MGPTPGPPAAVGDAEGLVEVEVADVGAELAGVDYADLGVEVGTVEVDLAAVGVDDLADLANLFFEDAVGGGIGDHDAGEDICVLGGLFAEVFYVDVAVLVAADADYFHAGHLGGGRVGAVRGGGDEADVAMAFVSAAVVGADGE